jgi:chromosome partitioning protein
MIITVANQKGGVGKTDLCVNLASCVARAGKNVLVIDLDPQANATDYLMKNKPDKTMTDVLIRDEVMKKVVSKTKVRNLFLAPGSGKLSAADVKLLSDVSAQFILKRKLKFAGDYDFIFIDTPPSLGMLTINSLTASTHVLVPVQVHYFSSEGVEKLLKTVESIRMEINPKLEVFGYVLTMVDKRNRLSLKMESKIRERYGEKVFDTHIPVNVDLADAPSFHKPIMLHSSNSRGAWAYSNLCKEFLDRHGQL